MHKPTHMIKLNKTKYTCTYTLLFPLKITEVCQIILAMDWLPLPPRTLLQPAWGSMNFRAKQIIVSHKGLAQISPGGHQGAHRQQNEKTHMQLIRVTGCNYIKKSK